MRRTSPPAPRRAPPVAVLLALALALLPVRVSAKAAPRVEKVIYIGPRGIDLTELRAAARPLEGVALSEEVLLAVLERLSGRDRLGGIDFEVRPKGGAGRVEVVVRYDGQPGLVEGVDVTTTAPRVGANENRQDLWRRIQASGAQLHLSEGRRFHPYHLRLDAETARRWFTDRGHLDALVRPRVEARGELRAIDIKVTPGPRYKLRELAITGLPEEGTTPRDLGLRPGQVPSARDLEKARAKLRLLVCRSGRPKAAVALVRKPQHDAKLDLELRVDAGPAGKVSVVEVGESGLPEDVIEEMGLEAGEPFCPDDVDRAIEVVQAYLRDEGFPEARVTIDVRREGPEKVQLWLTIDRRRAAVVERVWFRGHTVTRRKVLMQLVSVKVGNALSQSAIETSEENLRRSGLFRRVAARTIKSSDGDGYYIVFELMERDLVQVDFGNQEVTLHNMNVAWPDSVEDATDGVTLRGGGQKVRLTGNPDWIGVGISDPFLWDSVLATVDIDLRFHSFGDLDETATTLKGGAGVRALENRFGAQFLAFINQTTRDAPSSYDALPVARKNGASLGLGVETTLDLNRLDAERVAYFGFNLALGARTAGILPGQSWSGWGGKLELNLPLSRNRRGQHWVLGLRGEGRWVAGKPLTPRGLNPDNEEAPLFAHQRLTPTARGYASSAIRNEFDIDNDEVRLGGLVAYSSTVALRAPLPWRRNALVAFADLASQGGRSHDPRDDLFTAIGLLLRFSLFDERLEGTVFGAYPLRDDVEAEYFGIGAGGSFG